MNLKIYSVSTSHPGTTKSGHYVTTNRPAELKNLKAATSHESYTFCFTFEEGNYSRCYVQEVKGDTIVWRCESDFIDNYRDGHRGVVKFEERGQATRENHSGQTATNGSGVWKFSPPLKVVPKAKSSSSQLVKLLVLSSMIRR